MKMENFLWNRMTENDQISAGTEAAKTETRNANAAAGSCKSTDKIRPRESILPIHISELNEKFRKLALRC